MAIVGEAHVVVRAITTGFQQSIQDAVQRANLAGQGSQAGQAFGRGFSRGTKRSLSGFAAEAEQARVALAKLTRQGYFAGPAISGLVSAVGALGAGLFAMGAQVGYAASSLIVLPGIISSVMQAAIVAKVAFGGLGKAIGEMSKSGTQTNKLTGALSRVENAQKRVKKAQDALNRSYEIARERIQQLGFDVEDAAIAERRAALDLEDARNTLARVQDLPPNNRARIEAELAFQEADLNYRRTIDRAADLTAEQNKITDNGKRNAKEQEANSEEVLSAQAELRESIRDLAKAEKELQDARTGGGAGSAVSKLSEEAKEFAKFIVGLKPKIDELRAAAGKELFPLLTTAISNLANDPNLFPLLRDQFRLTGEAIGLAAVDFSKAVTEADNLKNLNTVMTTNRDTVEKFGKVAGNLYSVFLSLLSAADPLIRRFTDWVTVLTDGWKATAEAKNQSGELTDKFNAAGDAAAQLGDIFGNLFSAIKEIGKAASGPGSGGQMLMDSFEGATQKFEDFVKNISADGSLEQYFRDVVPTVEAIGRIFVEIGRGIATLGNNKETAEAFDSLAETVPVIVSGLDKFSAATPALGEFISKFVSLLSKFAESESINIFFGIINKVLDVLNAVFANSVVQRIFIFASSIKAVMIAAMTLNTVFGFFGRAIAGTILKVIGLGKAERGLIVVKKLWNAVMHTSFVQTKLLQAMYLKDAAMKKIAAAATKAWTAIQTAFNAVMAGNPIALVVLAIVALIAIIVVAYKKFDWFKNVVDSVFRVIKSVITGVWDSIKTAFEFVWGAITAYISFYWNNIIKPIFDAMLTVFSAVWDGIKTAFEFVWNIVSKSISFYWNNVIKPVFQAFGTIFSAVWDGIKTSFTKAWDFIVGVVDGAKTVFGKVKDAIVGAFKSAINFIIRGWNNLDFKIPEFKVGPIKFGGFTLGLPDIPELAEGGVVPARPGGMLARIGEGGRPERVEPLDKDGLSKRDKAIIAMLSGGGSTFNIYPSPGMNEVELASLVNRQIAFQLRKGAA